MGTTNNAIIIAPKPFFAGHSLPAGNGPLAIRRRSVCESLQMPLTAVAIAALEVGEKIEISIQQAIPGAQRRVIWTQTIDQRTIDFAKQQKKLGFEICDLSAITMNSNYTWRINIFDKNGILYMITTNLVAQFN
jgi:hypothetical protein